MLLLRRWRLTRKAVALARDTPDGVLARITGTVVALGDALVAPLTGETCVAVCSMFRLMSGRADENKPAPFGDGRIDEVALVPFVVAAGDLRATIVATDAHFMVPRKRVRSAERESMFLARHGMAAGVGRFREQLVRVGDRITVIGTVVLDGSERPAGDVGFRDAVAAIKLAGSAKHPIVIL